MRLIDRVIDLALGIQQVPAPTFAEGPRAEFVRQRFQDEKLADVSIDTLNNVYARLPGASGQVSLVVSAHTDTVFPAHTDLTAQRTPEQVSGPGIGDNSLGVAGLFGLLWSLREADIRLPGDLWLVANVGEEGLGDLNGMRAVVDRFEDAPFAYIVLEGLAYGRVYHQGLGVRRYRITAHTEGGHSWVNYGTPSAIHDLAALITQLTALRLPKDPRTTLNVGVISGGTSVNTVAAEASIELDLRSEGTAQLEELILKVEMLVRNAQREGLDYTMKTIGDRPVGAIPEDHPLVRLAVDVIAAQGVSPELNIGSTDANIPLSRGYPAICIGLTQGGGAHTVGEFMLVEPLKDGLAQLVEIVHKAYTLIF
jgi:acetylornithine deacetylase/succinyl-diaminopimelate desuccinylase-like protein